MKWVAAAAAEVLGLFVDDAGFALSIVAWLVVIGVLAWGLGPLRLWCGPALFVGLAAILVAGVLRGPRRS